MLEVSNLTVYFHTRNGIVKAVENVSYSINKGETLGIVGESGSGKSVSSYALLGLIPSPPGRIESGTAFLHGSGAPVDLLSCGEQTLRKLRGHRLSMIFQDPMTSLNPYLKISTQLTEPLELHLRMDRRAALRKAIEALEEVGIQDAARRVHMYPHEFSGGMRQRVMIAMALITEPEILIADEPTTALDVTVQAQILDIIRRRQRELGTTVILITHDLGVVAGFCERVNVMYAGRIVESGSVEQIFKSPAHPYTVALQRSIPSLHRKGEELFTIPGMPPDLSTLPPGCAFARRCAFAAEGCREVSPGLQPVSAAGGHQTACLRVQNQSLPLPLISRP